MRVMCGSHLITGLGIGVIWGKNTYSSIGNKQNNPGGDSRCRGNRSLRGGYGWYLRSFRKKQSTKGAPAGKVLNAGTSENTEGAVVVLVWRLPGQV